MIWHGVFVPEWLSLLILLGLIAAVVGFALCLKGRADASLRRAFDGLKVSATPQPWMVFVVFHTYHGLLVYTIQTAHHFWASPEDARVALWRLHRSNLTWGMFAQGIAIIPLLSYFNYLAQKRSIVRQSAKPKSGGLDDELA
ncbi:hypothetical protein [Aquisphaera insulae]|uniref:hypothetical protein n=1 Tax=Aquisphaera insulae TaxID=2712864 RepID=UPI0013EBFA54|nr:hypothetical protein [Aquisphaera insulae]